MAQNSSAVVPGHEFVPRPGIPIDPSWPQQNLGNPAFSTSNTSRNDNSLFGDVRDPLIFGRDDRSITTTIDDAFYRGPQHRLSVVSDTLTRSVSGPSVLRGWKTWSSRFSRFLQASSGAKTSETYIKPVRNSRAVMAPVNDLWDNEQVISITFLDGGEYQKMKFWELLRECEEYVNLQFVDGPSGGGDIRITFSGGITSESCIGTKCKEIDRDKPTLCLRGIRDCKYTATGMSWQETYTILHEIGHALGLLHEHQSPNRYPSLRFKEEGKAIISNVRNQTIDYFRRNHRWGPSTTQEEALTQMSPTQVSSYSEFDPTSAMMYRFPGAIVKGHWKHGLTVNHKLSPLDKAYLMLHYAPPQPPLSDHVQLSQWRQKVGDAMRIAGVSLKKQEVILSAQGVTPDDIRNTFIEWNQDRHLRKSPWWLRRVQ